MRLTISLYESVSGSQFQAADSKVRVKPEALLPRNTPVASDVRMMVFAAVTPVVENALLESNTILPKLVNRIAVPLDPEPTKGQ